MLYYEKKYNTMADMNVVTITYCLTIFITVYGNLANKPFLLPYQVTIIG